MLYILHKETYLLYKTIQNSEILHLCYTLVYAIGFMRTV